MKMKPYNNAYCGVTLLSKSFTGVLASAFALFLLARKPRLISFFFFLVYVGHRERKLEYIHRAQSRSNRKCARVCENKTDDNVKFVKRQTEGGIYNQAAAVSGGAATTGQLID